MSGNCIEVSFCAIDKNDECEYDIMNSGNSVLVFSTVVSILKKLLDDLHPRMLIFSAKEPSRRKLYLRMVKTLLPTWETSVFDDGDDGSMGLVVKDPTFSISDIQKLILTDIKNVVGSFIFPPLVLNYEIGHTLINQVGGQYITNVPTPDEMLTNPNWIVDYKILCKEALLTNYYPASLDLIPKEYRDEHLCMIAVKRAGSELQYVPTELRDEHLCMIAVKKNGYALPLVPIELPEYAKIAMVAVQQDGYLLQYVPTDLPEYKEIAMVAVQQYGDLLDYVPTDLPEYKEIAMAAVKQNSWALEYVPTNMQAEINAALSKQDELSRVKALAERLIR